jgi:hypothetical protein
MRPPGTRRPTGGKVALCRVGRIKEENLEKTVQPLLKKEGISMASCTADVREENEA